MWLTTVGAGGRRAYARIRKDSYDTTAAPGTIYSLRLRTPIYHHKQSSAVLEKIRRRWQKLDVSCSC